MEPEKHDSEPAKFFDWDIIYREGTPPWETGVPAAELVRAVEEGMILPGTVLEIGCGTGADAVYLVKRGFEVTAVDSSPTAVERARVRAEQENALPRFITADIFEFAPTAGQFDFVYDAGLYHYIRLTDLNKYLDVLWRVTRPGSFYMTLAGAPVETAGAPSPAAAVPGATAAPPALPPAQPGAPPPVTKRQIYNELGRLFEIVRLESCRLAGPYTREGYAGWTCLMRRPVLKPTT